MVENIELKVCPNLDYIGIKIEREKFIELASDSEYKNNYFRFNVEDVILLYSIPIEKNNSEIQILQVNLNDAFVFNSSIKVITELIQRNIPYQTIIIFVYKQYIDPKEFISHYKVVVPKIHKGVKKDIYVVDQIAMTNLIYENKLNSIFGPFEKQINSSNSEIDEIINNLYTDINNGNYGYFEVIPDSEEEELNWSIVARKWVSFIEKENLPEDPQTHIEDGFLSYSELDEYRSKKIEAVEKHYGKSIEELLNNATDSQIDEYESFGDKAIEHIFNEKRKNNWINHAKKWIITDVLEEYQEIYGYDLIDEFIEYIFYDLENLGEDNLIAELKDVFRDLGYEDEPEGWVGSDNDDIEIY